MLQSRVTVQGLPDPHARSAACVLDTVCRFPTSSAPKTAKAAMPGSRQGRPASRVRTHRRSRVIGQPGCRPDGGPCRPRWRDGGVGLPNCTPRWPSMTTGDRMSAVRAPCAAPILRACQDRVDLADEAWRTGWPAGCGGPSTLSIRPAVTTTGSQPGPAAPGQPGGTPAVPATDRTARQALGPRKVQQTIAGRAGLAPRRGAGGVDGPDRRASVRTDPLIAVWGWKFPVQDPEQLLFFFIR